MTAGCRAAVEAGRHLGLVSDDPMVVQETNHTVVWLRPHAVMAKVATRTDGVEGLVRDHQVARALSAQGAPVGVPLDAEPWADPASGYAVTLWHRLVPDLAAPVSDVVVGRSLFDLHEALAHIDVPLPDFRLGIRRAQVTASDEDHMALTPGDLDLLRATFDELLPLIDGSPFRSQPLHGKPHDGNRLVTASGTLWIDFENTCQGPVEWDLAFVSAETRRAFGAVDDELLASLVTLTSACVATWCGTRSSGRFPAMQRHAVHHLQQLRTGGRRAP